MAEGHRAVDAHEALALGVVEVREREARGARRRARTVAMSPASSAAASSSTRRAASGRCVDARSGRPPRPRRARRRADDRLDPVELRLAERRRAARAARAGCPARSAGADRARRRATARFEAGAEQRLGVLSSRPPQLSSASPGRVEVASLALAGRHQQRDRLGLEAPRREDERLGRRRGRATGRRRRSTARGRSSHASASRLSSPSGDQEPVLHARRSSGPARRAARRPEAAGSRSISSRHGRTSWCMPANGSSCSASMPTQRRTVMSRRAPAAYSSSAVLPMPGSPRSTSTALRSPRALSRSASRARRSDSRPTSISSRS